MPSSISSSNERLPSLKWKRILVLTAVITASVLFFYEAYGRAKGFVPSINDDAELWCYARAHVGRGDPCEVALIGSSRMQFGINPKLLAQELRCRTTQLAINGASPLPVLLQLSRDERFRGWMLCEVHPEFFFALSKPKQGTAVEYIRKYQQESAVAGLEESLRILVQSWLVLRSVYFSPKTFFRAMYQSGQSPAPSYIVTMEDRSKLADFSKADLEKLREYRIAQTRLQKEGTDAASLERDLNLLEEMVSRIQGRGGKVIFIVFPTSGLVRRLEQEHYPRAEYWDRLAERTQAITIHWEDYPSLTFDCPDGSHLDYRDADKFTIELARIIRQKLGWE